MAIVKELDPVLIVPGNEKGVILATKLANDLNLLCNPIENLDAITLKNEMQNRLAENNLRSIRGRVVKSVEEAIEYYDSEGLGEVVVKPIYGAASVGVNICLNRHEMIDSVSDVFNQKGYYGNESAELLIQERINGEEYIVNTVSCGGVHRVTTFGNITKSRPLKGVKIMILLNPLMNWVLVKRNLLNMHMMLLTLWVFNTVLFMGNIWWMKRDLF